MARRAASVQFYSRTDKIIAVNTGRCVYRPIIKLRRDDIGRPEVYIQKMLEPCMSGDWPMRANSHNRIQLHYWRANVDITAILHANPVGSSFTSAQYLIHRYVESVMQIVIRGIHLTADRCARLPPVHEPSSASSPKIIFC